MGYQVFDESSCTLTADERRAEATRIVDRLLEDHKDSMTIGDKLTIVSLRKGPVSIKQLFMLRDINGRY